MRRAATGERHGRGARWAEAREAAEAMSTPMLVLAGKDACARSDLLVLDAVRSVLVARADAGGRAAIGAAIADLVGRGLASLWEHGWQPAELARAVRRHAAGGVADLLLTAMAAPGAWTEAGGSAPPPPWASQLADLGVRAWWGSGADFFGPWADRSPGPWSDALDLALRLLVALAALPALEIVTPPPSQWSGWIGSTEGVDEGILAKVRALLAKAESTSFEAEAEALTTKAQALMARHAIDDALARRRDGTTARPRARRFAIDDPYASAKSMLLAGVAAANGGRSVWRPKLALTTVVAHDAELDAIDTLFTSLLVQADRALLAEGRRVDARGRSRTRAFRQSFLVAFADRIAERLARAATGAAEQASEDIGSSVLPVLAHRQEEVDAAVDELFPRLSRRRGPRITSSEGWAAGRTAADLAHLGPDKQVTARRRSPAPPGLR